MKFLSHKEAQRFILSDADGYLASLSPSDLLARRSTRSGYFLEAARAMVCGSPSLREKVLRSYALLNKVFDIPLPKEIYIAFFHKPYEGGYPHTRQNIIFLPITVSNMSDHSLTALLAHELVHVSQRAFPEIAQNTLAAHGFFRIRPVVREDNVRANPDTDSYMYTQSVPEQYRSISPSGITDIIQGGRHPYEVIAYSVQDLIRKKLNQIE